MLFIGMAIVIISLIGNYLFFKSKQLAKPIMLKHYYELEAVEGRIFELHYIVNKHEDFQIAYGVIPNSDIQIIPTYEHQTGDYQYYQIKAVGFELADELLEKHTNTNLELNQLLIYFTNGESQLMEIGELTLYSNKQSEFPFDYQSSGSSSDHNGYQSAIAQKDLKITGIEVPFADDLSSALSLKINNDQLDLKEFLNQMETGNFSDGPLDHFDTEAYAKELEPDLFPYSLRFGEMFAIYYQFDFKKNDPHQVNHYSIDIKLLGEDEDGQAYTSPFQISYHPYIDEKVLRSIVKEQRNDEHAERDK